MKKAREMELEKEEEFVFEIFSKAVNKFNRYQELLIRQEESSCRYHESLCRYLESLSKEESVISFIERTEILLQEDIKENHEKEKERQKNFIRSYPKTEKGKATFRNAWAKRRALMKNSIIDIDDEEKEKIKQFYANTPGGYHVDHIIPLSKGGKHCFINLQYLKKSENLTKNAKICKKTIMKFCEDREISIPFLMRKFKLTYEDAKEISEKINKAA